MRSLQNRQACIVSCKNSYVQSLALKAYSYPCYEKIPACGFAYKNHNGCFNGRGQPCRQRSSAEEQHNGKLPYDAGNHSCGRKRAHQKGCKEKDIEIELLKGKEASKVSPTDSRSFKILEELCMRTDNNYIVAPYLVMGGTDSYHYENICDCIYRFAPFEVDTKYLLLTHATNERIPVDCMEGALKFFKRYIKYMSKE